MTCYRRDDLPWRALVGRHEPTCTREECHGCQPCPEPHCRKCHQQHTPTVCPGCLALVRVDLRTLGVLSTRLDHEAQHGRPAYHTHDGIPGGDAVVLAAPGHHYLDQHRTSSDEHANDPRPPLAVLTAWLHYWTGDPSSTPTLRQAVLQLDSNLHHYATDLAFLTMARDLARSVRQVEDVLHDGERPEVSRVPCLECGTRIVKVYGSREAADYWLCPRCGEKYDRGRYDRAKHDHLASQGANRYVSVADATAAVGRPVQTVRSWIRRGLVDTQYDPSTGRLMGWWPDIRNLHLTTSTRDRRTARVIT